jgi:hypothetical protein
MAWFPGRRRERGSEPSGPLGLNTHWAGWLLRMKNWSGLKGRMALGPAEATGPAFSRRLLCQKNGEKAGLQRKFDLQNLAADLDLFQGFWNSNQTIFWIQIKGFKPRRFSNSIKGSEWILNLRLKGFGLDLKANLGWFLSQNLNGFWAKEIYEYF